jgi:hypothetical protein
MRGKCCWGGVVKAQEKKNDLFGVDGISLIHCEIEIIPHPMG